MTFTLPPEWNEAKLTAAKAVQRRYDDDDVKDFGGELCSWDEFHLTAQEQILLSVDIAISAFFTALEEIGMAKRLSAYPFKPDGEDVAKAIIIRTEKPHD